MKPISLKHPPWWFLAILGMLPAWQFAKGNSAFEKLLQAGAWVAGLLIAFSLLATFVRWSRVTRIRTLKARLKHAESTRQPIRPFPLGFCILAVAMALVCCGGVAWAASVHGKESIGYGALGTGSLTIVFLIVREVIRQHNVHQTFVLISRLPPTENPEDLYGLARDLSRPEALKPAFSKPRQAGGKDLKVVAQKGKDGAPKIPKGASLAPEPKGGESPSS